MKKFLLPFLVLFSTLALAQQQDGTAITYDITRPNGKTTAQINSMTRMVEGSEAWNTDTGTYWRYVSGTWTDTGSSTGVTDGDKGDITVASENWTIDNGVVTEPKLSTSVNASLDLADSALQSGDNVSELVNDAGYITEGGNLIPVTQAEYDLLSPTEIAENDYAIVGEDDGSGSGGGIQSVVAGTNIAVDNTDPDNPIVSTSNVVTTNTSQTITGLKTFDGRVGQTGLGNSTFFGSDAGESDDLTSNNNSGFGFDALNANISGSNNVAFGYNSLLSTTNGNTNTAIGASSLQNYGSGQSNSALGFGSFMNLTSGDYNTALGTNAGRYVGASPGSTPLTTSNDGVYIGTNSRASVDSPTNEIVIGRSVLGNGSNTVTIGNSNVTTNYFNGDMNVTGNYLISGSPMFDGDSGTTGLVLKGNGSGTYTFSTQEWEWSRSGDIVYWSMRFTGIDGNTPTGEFQIDIGATTIPSISTPYSVFGVITSLFPINYYSIQSRPVDADTVRLQIQNTLDGSNQKPLMDVDFTGVTILIINGSYITND